MRVLLDENIDRRIKRAFDSDFDVATVTECKWSGLQNGELLRRAEAGFDALVTMDKGIEHQQNLTNFELGVVIISARSNRRQDIESAMPNVNAVLRSIKPGKIIVVGS